MHSETTQYTHKQHWEILVKTWKEDEQVIVLLINLTKTPIISANNTSRHHLSHRTSLNWVCAINDYTFQASIPEVKT